jgi:hypothetical protein
LHITARRSGTPGLGRPFPGEQGGSDPGHDGPCHYCAWRSSSLIVAGDDLRVMVYTAEPGTEDAERLALAIVLGTQSLVD